MKSINPDGTVTAKARRLLNILDEPLTPEEISQTLGQPIVHVKSSLREMVVSQIIHQQGERFIITEQGKEKR
jgi:predicted transcriptional regulator